MKKHYVTHVEDTDKSISVAGPVLDYKQWYTDYIKLMEEQAQRKYGLYTPEDAFPTLPGDVTRWSFKGLTNEQMSKNPRLEDVDGKGRFLTFKNFAWGEMSGVGGYTQNYNNSAYWKLALDRAETTKTGHSFNVTSVTSTVVAFYYQSRRDQEPFTVKSQIVRVSGLTDGQSIKYKTGAKSVLVIESDGIYTLPPFDFAAKGTWYGFSFGKIQESCNITLEQLPYYPDALVFDGVDDCGICENFPILTKEKGYTVVALRKWLTPEDKANNEVLIANLKGEVWNAPNLGAFGCEIKYNNSDPKVVRASSFGQESKININENDLLFYQTSNSYNGVNLASGIGNSLGGSFLIVGSGGKTSLRANAAIWELIILDHDATEEELTKIKNYFIKTYPWLFFDQAWTVVGKSNEDTDRATIANITGNGNNLVLSNFGFAGNSGYGEYAYNWNTWKINKVDSTKSNVYHNRMEITLPAKGESLSTRCNLYSPLCEVGTIYDFSFKISGLTDSSTVFIKPGTNGGGAIIAQYNKDGVYHLNYTLTDEAIINESTQNRIYFFVYNYSDEEMNLTIEQIPDHEGYLVTDGVDDKIVSSSFGMGKDFTVVGEWTLLQNINVSSLRKQSSFIIRNNDLGLSLFINRISHATLVHTKSLRAFCSNGVLYKSDWTEQIDTTPQDITSSNSELLIASHYDNKSEYDKIAFKNLAIYPTVLSKDDCIKAYNYLQILKAK